MKALILGGARSGKSAQAETLAARLAARERAELAYIATAEAWDHEMRERIAAHQARRGDGWREIEAPRDLAAALDATARPGVITLVDCLTLWLTNEMLADKAGEAGALDAAVSAFLRSYRAAKGPVIAVSNELGLGVTPASAMGRRFRDLQGRLNQDVAALSEYVMFVAAGLPLTLKGAPPA